MKSNHDNLKEIVSLFYYNQNKLSALKHIFISRKIYEDLNNISKKKYIVTPTNLENEFIISFRDKENKIHKTTLLVLNKDSRKNKLIDYELSDTIKNFINTLIIKENNEISIRTK